MRPVDRTPAATAAALKCDLAGEMLRSFGLARFPAVGWSMLPAIWPGDTLLVERVHADELHLGDILVVGRQGRLCAHRLIGTSGDPGNPRWITQGDALAAPDRPVAGSELFGRVSYLIRAGKRMTVPAQLSFIQQLVARVARRSVAVARALVYLRRLVQTPGKSAPEKSVLPCQG
jgi:hypothetical protein